MSSHYLPPDMSLHYDRGFLDMVRDQPHNLDPIVWRNGVDMLKINSCYGHTV